MRRESVPWVRRSVERCCIPLLLSLALLAWPAAADEIETKTFPLKSPNEPPEIEDPNRPPTEPLTPTLSLSLGGSMLSEQDMADTYGFMPWIGVGIAMPIAQQVDTFVNLEYGSDTGDPFYDNPDFGGFTSRVRSVPLSVGVKIDASQYKDFSMYFGLGLQFAWIEETVPRQDIGLTAATSTHDGWGKGFILFLAPEWRPRGGPLGFGIEMGWGGSEATVGKGSTKHLVGLSGYKGRLYVSWEL